MNEFNENSLNLASSELRAISHPVRLTVLCHLTEKAMNVSELLEIINIPQPSLSQHLAKLRGLGIIESDRRGQQIYYHLSNPGYEGIITALRGVYCT